MKRILLLTFILSVFISGFAQRPVASKEVRNFKAKKIQPISDMPMNLSQIVLPITSTAKTTAGEDQVGETYYDLQTNSTVSNRIHVYDDGTMGAVWTFSGETGFADRGTGYNYFDGSDWGEYPNVRIEDDRTGWPAYAAWGENGEIVISHYSGASIDGMAISNRATKGDGDWTFYTHNSPLPDDAPYLWPKMATGGENNSVVHLIALTRPINSTPAGIPYLGVNGALLYNRSSDGGATWDIEHEMFEELNSDHYKNFGGDGYALKAEGDNVAILYGDGWVDFGLMKSTDGGDTWTQTIIWNHPYPLFDNQNPIVTENFYNVDGAYDMDFDESGKVHVVFGINRATCDGSWPGSWFPGVGGIGYWNEDRPTFSADTNALCPWPGTEDCSYSELVEDYNLIGWDQDVNGNDTIDWTADDPAYFYVGTSSMPKILVDDMNQIFVVWSSITETYTSGTPAKSCRHIWCRTSPNGEWWGSFTDITSDPIHLIDDCVWPSIYDNPDDDSFVVVFQHDIVPGNSLQGNPVTAVGLNSISVLTVDKDEVWTSVEENNTPIFDYDVMQNYPNPFTSSSTVQVNLRQSTQLSLEVVNMMGQVVYTVDAGVAQPGMNTINIDGTNLTSGVYFYTVRAGETAITKKMIVE